jgi:hypothetical protein
MVRAAGIALLAVLVLALPVTAQLPEADPGEPTVEVEDVTFEDPIPPGAGQGQTSIEVQVGCDAQEVPNTTTLLVLQPSQSPDWARLSFAPPVPQWQTEVGDCPAPEPPFTATLEAFASLDSDAPALEETTFPLEATVQKIPPEGEARTYGPYEANATLTPDYRHAQRLAVDETAPVVAHDETATFALTVTNEGNGEARYAVSAASTQPPTDVAIDPTETQLPPGEETTVDVTVSLADTAIAEDTVVEVDVTVDGETTLEGADGSGSDTETLEATFEAPEDAADDGAEDGIPAPGLAGLAAALGLATAARRRA